MSTSTTATAIGKGLAACGLICEASTAGLSISVQVNWNGDGSTFVEEGASANHVMSVGISRGRANVNDIFGAGQASVRLKNADGRFSPFNPLSPLYPNVVGGRAVKIQSTYHGVVYPLFIGTIVEPDQSVIPTYSEVTIQAIDAFERFRLAVADADLQVNQRIDQILTAILAANSWGGGSTLDVGSTLMTYAQPSTNVLAALQDAALQEVGGALWMGKDGTVTFTNRDHRANAPIQLVLGANAVEQVALQARQSDLYATVTVTYAAYTWSAPSTSSYSGQQGLPLYPGYTTVTDYYGSAVQNVVTPQPEADYTVIDQQQPPVFPTPGTGVQPFRAVDVSGSVRVTTFTTTGTSFTLTLFNGLPYTVWLQNLQIRATAVATQPNPRKLKVVAPGTPLGTGQTLTAAFNWVQDDARIAAWAMQRAAVLATQHPRPVVQVMGKTPALIHALLGADLAERILVDMVTGLEGGATRVPLGTASATGNVSSLAVNYSAPIAAGDLIVIGYLLYGTGTTTITASDGTNSATNSATLNNALNAPQFRTGEMRVLNAAAVAAGTTLTLTWATTCPAAIWVSKIVARPSATFDVIAGTTGASTAPDSGATAVTAAPIDYAFGVVGAAGSGLTLAPGAGWTLGQSVAIGSSAQLFELYQELASRVALHATGTLSGSANWTALVGTYVEGTRPLTAFLPGLRGQFYIEHLDLQLVPGGLPQATLQLFDQLQGQF